MTRRTIGIIDYGVGNLASVRNALHGLGYRCRVSKEHTVLDQTDLLLLPGVGAFPNAMRALHAEGLHQYLKDNARKGKPVLGICLGMQLLADSSTEIKITAGLGLIPGQVSALNTTNWHIGWNSIEIINDDALFKPGDGQAVYFNHSYVLHTPDKYQVGVSRIDSLSQPFPVIVRRNNVVGLQFHPEKSQTIGRKLLARIIEGLCDA